MLDLDPTVRTGGRPRGPSRTFQQGDQLGRYIVLDHLGAGGMGTVYAAYDSTLDRKVALKLLLGTGSPEFLARARLTREAKALAQLSHPNVVAVHDVGVVAERIFVSMEFVEGTTLRAWIDEGPHAWAEAKPLFLAAGRGLAAAHEAGIVHRDFKPANVLVGENGRVCVADFGLAVAVEEGHPSDPSEDHPVGLPGLTQTGTVMGTPAYMAPEQACGEVTDARADQYSFCLTLFEALVGRRPFAEGTQEALVAAKRSGKVKTLPSDRKLPVWLRRVLVRGLAPRPVDRYLDMRALLSALGREPLRRRVRYGTWAAGAVLFAGVGAVGARLGNGAEGCEELEDLEAEWNPDLRERLALRFASVGRSFGAATWTRIEGKLEEFATTWMVNRRDACEATHRRHEQSEQVMALRVACLNERRVEFRTLIALFEDANASVAARAGAAVEALSPVEACDDVASLVQRDGNRPAVLDPAAAAAATEALAKGRTLHAAGSWHDALITARDATELADTSGDPGLRAATRLLIAMLVSVVEDDPAQAERLILEAVDFAAAARRDELSAQVWIDLVHVVAVSQRRPEEGLHYARAARAALTRLRTPSGHATVHFHKVMGRTLIEAGKIAEAVEEYNSALEHSREFYGERSRRTAQVLRDLADAYNRLGKLEEAEQRARLAVEISEEDSGSEHPDVALNFITLGIIQYGLGNAEASLESFRAALEIRRGAFDGSHPAISEALNNVANALMGLGHYDDALATFAEVLELDRRAGEGHPRVGMTLHNIASVKFEQGHHADAYARYKEALAHLEKSLGPGHPQLTEVLESTGKTATRLGESAEAIAYFERSLKIWRAGEQMGSPLFAQALTDYAEALRQAGRRVEATSTAREAVDRLQATPADPRLLASARFELAKNLWSTDRAEAETLLATAIERLKASGPEHEGAAGPIIRWRDAHR